jgi:hypothetical protein
MKLLKFAGLSLLLLAGCAPVSQASFDFNGIQKDHAVAYDIRTGEHWYNRLWASPHRLIAYRKEDGTLLVNVEQSNPDLLSELSGPLSGAASHVTIPVVP